MSAARLDVHVGARILTAQGMAVVRAIQRHAVVLEDATGVERTVPYTQLSGRSATAASVDAIHASLLPWFDSLDEATIADASFKHEICTELITGYRYGLPELAQPGEPFYPFGPTFGVSLSARIRAMSQLISYERAVDRATMRRVHEGQIKTGLDRPGKGGGLDLPRRMESCLHRRGTPTSCVDERSGWFATGSPPSPAWRSRVRAG